MGTPDFAAATLQAVLDNGAARVTGVYTQPDRPCGRGHKCTPPPVKRLALEHGLSVHQPLNFRDRADVDQLAALAPDVLLVAAYGLILPQSVLDIPRLGPWNVHASLLPRYRGAAPIQRSIMDGCAETGITIMRMEKGLDTGPMLLARAIPIGADEDAQSLHDRLAALGGEMAVEALGLLAAGPVHPAPQDDALATYAAKLTRADALIHWDRPAKQVHDHIRAMSPKPGAAFHIPVPGENRHIRLLAQPGAFTLTGTPPGEPGSILGCVSGTLDIACADGVYHIRRLQPAGKKPMDAQAFACGYLGKLAPGVPLVCPAPADLLD
uniref:Methionyl-tRNA formyltransferase n=1 Tax=Fundidesulfovibrio putealis TaxID=270496 RepID=A0A7C4EK81_9BACT